MFKKIISFFIVFAILFSCCLSASAHELTSEEIFNQWLQGNSIPFIKWIFNSTGASDHVGTNPGFPSKYKEYLLSVFDNYNTYEEFIEDGHEEGDSLYSDYVDTIGTDNNATKFKSDGSFYVKAQHCYSAVWDWTRYPYGMLSFFSDSHYSNSLQSTYSKTSVLSGSIDSSGLHVYSSGDQIYSFEVGFCFVSPVDCTWSLTNYSYSALYKKSSDNSFSSISCSISKRTGTASANDSVTGISFSSSQNYPWSELSISTIPPDILITPVVPVTLPSTDTRPTELDLPVFLVEEDDAHNIHNGVIVNENMGTYLSPVTNVSTNMTDWTYDYATRAYDITLETGDTVNVTYGDTNLTINEGGNTYTYNYYVASEDSSGDGSGTDSGDDSDGGILGKLGELVGTLFGGLISLVEKLLGAILDGLVSLLQMLVDKVGDVVDLVLSLFEDLPTLFGGFLDLLTAVFAFVPGPLITLLTFGVVAVIALGIFKAFRR